jgi:hypothetical protein
MKAGLSVSLGVLFVGLATFNVITMLQSSRSAQAPRTRARAIALHRAGGYLFIALFAVMIWFMSKRLMGSPEAMAGDAALHIDLAILLAPLIFLKVMIARKYKSHHSVLLPLGLAIFAISFVLVFIRVLPNVGRIGPSSSIVKYSYCFLALFCFFLVSSSSSGTLTVHQFITLFFTAAVAAVYETAFRHVFSRTYPQRSTNAGYQDALFSHSGRQAADGQAGAVSYLPSQYRRQSSCSLLLDLFFPA